MRTLILVTTATLWLLSQTMGQEQTDDIVRLRTYLPMPESTPITRAKSPTLPSYSRLRIYLNTGGDQSAADEVIKLIQDKKVVDRYGAIEIVTDPLKANLFLIHYELVEKRHQEVSHNITMDPSSSSRIYTGGRSDSWTSTEIDGYILVRKPEGLEIVSAYRRTVKVGDLHKELRDSLFKLLMRK